jgi:glyoxylase-like metal-dependent hydrolase (beta-lactamase superfamily II)
MRAWGLLLAIVMTCGACASGAPAGGGGGGLMNRYGQPPLPDIENYDRADVEIVPGYFAAGRQPDGNSVLLGSADGLIVFDTGRRASHAERIAAAARARDAPIAAIINSHWHLDHVSGNIPLLAEWPEAAVHANATALDEALGGFLAVGLAANRKAVANAATPAVLAEDLRGDIATVERGDRLRPTVSIEVSQTLVIGGRRLDLHVAQGASAGDIWLYDPAARLVAAGDLITLPAPFLDTACPKAWSRALAEILAVPFERLAPGHGREMSRADVMLYRDGFDELIACAAGDAPAATCAAAWAAAAAPLLDGVSGDEDNAIAYATYYVEAVLRPGATRADCTAQIPA